MNVLTVHLVLSTLVFWIAARIYLVPRLGRLEPQSVLAPILLLHSFRHLGLMFLAQARCTKASRRRSPIRPRSAICSRPLWR